MGRQDFSIKLSAAEAEWILSGFAKICTKINSEKELIDVFASAKSLGLNAHLITDSGKTEFNGVATNTCCAIGPDYADKIDKITGKLELY